MMNLLQCATGRQTTTRITPGYLCLIGPASINPGRRAISPTSALPSNSRPAEMGLPAPCADKRSLVPLPCQLRCHCMQAHRRGVQYRRPSHHPPTNASSRRRRPGQPIAGGPPNARLAICIVCCWSNHSLLAAGTLQVDTTGILGLMSGRCEMRKYWPGVSGTPGPPRLLEAEEVGGLRWVPASVSLAGLDFVCWGQLVGIKGPHDFAHSHVVAYFAGKGL